ncbi:hypothetical protein SAMN05421772_1246 [Paracoccus saliphilus]|uniref:Uncharacterized protein n=1 Tax=Paracoccus saliphilus TaxID=405559 RepID=A0AA45W822_9RHOB|nr:hypothetical protein SAMN05421772_1246 [Paracoccus saliphilus]
MPALQADMTRGRGYPRDKKNLACHKSFKLDNGRGKRVGYG